MMVTQSKSILFRSVWYYLKCYIGNLFHIHTFGWTQSAQCAVLIVPTSVTSLITFQLSGSKLLNTVSTSLIKVFPEIFEDTSMPITYGYKG